MDFEHTTGNSHICVLAFRRPQMLASNNSKDITSIFLILISVSEPHRQRCTVSKLPRLLTTPLFPPNPILPLLFQPPLQLPDPLPPPLLLNLPLPAPVHPQAKILQPRPTNQHPALPPLPLLSPSPAHSVRLRACLLLKSPNPNPLTSDYKLSDAVGDFQGQKPL